MTSRTGVQIVNTFYDVNPSIGIVTAFLYSYQILLCTSVNSVPPLF